MNYSDLKRVLIGEPFPTHAEIHQRLDRARALAVFASDPISSNAYATEAIMSVLILLGSGALRMTIPIALAIAALVTLVIFSYIQTILHYPQGGGAYNVSKDNLGTMPSLIAASALLTDYVLTVAVSVSAGIRAATSAFPALHDYRVVLALVAIVLLTWINLRGVRESGTLFAFPTYAFVLGVLVMIGIGLVRYAGLFGAAPLTHATAAVEPMADVSNFLFIWLILRAFAAGCTALTGIEAISDGVPAFRPPESRNAAATMIWMGLIAMSLFLGISFLATHLVVVPNEFDSILSQLARQISGGGFLYYWIQAFTMLILILAANTGFQDFPRLSYFLARDGYLPRWLQNRGDRLVYSAGIVTLGVLASIIVYGFRANEIAMLPLYALGVMTSFTLSQAGMAHLMTRVGKVMPGEEVRTLVTTIRYESGWRWKQAVNITGAITTGVVLVILVVTKFVEGAWIVVVGVILLVIMLRTIKAHYIRVAQSLRIANAQQIELADIADVVIVPVADIHRGTLRALKYAKRMSTQVRAVSIITDDAQREHILQRWEQFPDLTEGIQLVLLDYEFRDIMSPLVEYIENVQDVEFPNQLVTIAIPEFVPRSWAGHLLHNQTANILRLRLRAHENIVVIDVPYLLNEDANPPQPKLPPAKADAEVDAEAVAPGKTTAVERAGRQLGPRD